jgi:hypothetical protein
MASRKKTRSGKTKKSQDEVVDDIVERVEDLVKEELGDDASFEEYEQAVLRITNEVARRRLQRKLQGLADGYAPQLRIDHNNDWHGWREGTAHEFREHLPGVVRYHSLVGPLEIRRFTYRECHRNGVTYVPLELDAGLMERMTPGLAKAVAFGISQMPVREVEEMLLAANRCPPSRSTLDRSGRDLGAYALACNEEIEPNVRAAESVPAQARAVVMGLDRTSVLMRDNQRPEPYCAGSRDIRRSRPRVLGDQSRGADWRLDYVGTVSFVDRHGKRIESRQYRIPSDAEPEAIVERMMEDLRHAMAQCPKLRVSVVQDGAPELWNAIRTALECEPLVKRWDEALDWYHVDERLSRCLDLCCEDKGQRARLRAQWHADFHEHPDGAERVLRSMRRRALRFPPERREELREHVDYFSKRRALTRYPKLRRRGLPIGSGVTEGACKSLIGVRAKRGGQRWTQRGLSATLHLRAIVESGRFDSFWAHFSPRYRADSIVPSRFAIRA